MSSSSSEIDFYFDFASPYGYLATRRIEAIADAHRRTVNWRPILLGAVFKISGQRPLLEVPLLDDYTRMDLPRSAREYQVEFRLPDVFPVGTPAAARAFYWVEARDPKQAVQLVHALYRAYFVDNINIGEPERVLDVAASCGVDRDELAQALQTPEIKAILRDAVEQAVERKVFGSPYFIVDGEHFWGNDRLDQMAKWLHVGGW